ncbi:copper chaperone PCu(A)C [Nonomuraea typhae]|uniref:copper chaperone PCu(A)C n=1 Tax=Nonomuraea typhae TaxID=2603600 RepID=UPI001FE74898|nr:copper chaperone PCu(A)C [Nonomuraea typhae]
MTSRRWIVAAASLLAAPVLAGCAAGFDANTNKPYAPTEGAALIQSGKYGSRGVQIPQAFILGPDVGAQLAQGGQAPVYLNVLSPGGDTIEAVTTDVGTAKLVAPVNVPAGVLTSTGKPTPQILIQSLAKPLKGGETVAVSIQFARAGTVEMSVPVVSRSREYTAYPPAPGATPAPAPTSSPSASPTTGGGH